MFTLRISSKSRRLKFLVTRFHYAAYVKTDRDNKNMDITCSDVISSNLWCFYFCNVTQSKVITSMYTFIGRKLSLDFWLRHCVLGTARVKLLLDFWIYCNRWCYVVPTSFRQNATLSTQLLTFPVVSEDNLAFMQCVIYRTI